MMGLDHGGSSGQTPLSAYHQDACRGGEVSLLPAPAPPARCGGRLSEGLGPAVPRSHATPWDGGPVCFSEGTVSGRPEKFLSWASRWDLYSQSIVGSR